MGPAGETNTSRDDDSIRIASSPDGLLAWLTIGLGRGESYWLLAALLVAFLVRLVAVLLDWGSKPQFDEADYVFLTRNLLKHLEYQHQGSFERPPGYVFFLGLHALIFRDYHNIARLTQVIVAVASQLALFQMVRPVFGTRVALASIWIFALYHDLVQMTTALRPEALFPFFLLTSLCLLLSANEPRSGAENLSIRRPLVLGAGLLYGIACLIRSTALSFLPLLLLWLLLTHPARLRSLVLWGLFVLGTLLAISPWTLRNYGRYQQLILVDQSAGFNLMLGNNKHLPPNWDVRREIGKFGYRQCWQSDLAQRNACNVRGAFNFIAKNPGLFLERIPLKMADLWNPYRRPLPTEATAAEPFAPWMQLVRVWQLFSFLLVMIAAVLGFALPSDSLRPRSQSALLLLVGALALHTMIVHSLTFGIIRFRLPLMPFLFIPAARALCQLPPRAALWGWPRILGVLLGLGCLLWLWTQPINQLG